MELASVRILPPLPLEGSYVMRQSENIVSYFNQVNILNLINGNKNYSILAQQIPR